MINQLLKRGLKDPFRAFYHLHSVFNNLWLRTRSNILFDGSVKFVGAPIIDIASGCYLYLGSDVTLNSRNKGYHINMHSPVKLMADRPGAVIRIGEGSRIHGTCIHAYSEINIGRNCLIAGNCQIFDGHGHDLCFPNVEDRVLSVGGSKPITIDDNVWIGANTIILPGVKIGFGSVIGANSVVSKEIPPMSVAVGNPAVVVRVYSLQPEAIPL